MIASSAKVIDTYSRDMNLFISGYTSKYEELQRKFPEIMKILVDERKVEGATERMDSLKKSYLRMHDIINGYDCKDPFPLITDKLIKEMKTALNKDELDWHSAANILSSNIFFTTLQDSGEFLYYDTITGTWIPGAEEIIAKILREAYAEKMTRYIREEVISFISQRR
ncbi:MAG: hypothetical protein ACYDDC_06155 [Thermoplasmataceae archaeon]